MALILADMRAEFCGTHFICEDGDITGKWMPDLLRCLKNWSISCSPGVIQNFKAGRTEALVQTKIAACMSRALDYAGILPTLSAKFITTAQR